MRGRNLRARARSRRLPRGAAGNAVQVTPQRRLAVAAPGGLVLLAAWLLPLALAGVGWWTLGAVAAAIALAVALALRT